MTTNTISAAEAANRARRAMALRDLLLEIGWDVERASALPQRGWDSLARTISERQVATGGKVFRSPSSATQAEAIELLRGALASAARPECPSCGTKLDSTGGCVFARLGSCDGPKIPLPTAATAAPSSAGAPSLRPESSSAGSNGAEAPRLGLNGRPRVPTNVTLMVD